MAEGLEWRTCACLAYWTECEFSWEMWVRVPILPLVSPLGSTSVQTSFNRKMDWSHRSSMRFSPMWLSISEKVVSNLRLAGSLRLPPPPKTDIPDPPLLPLHSSLPMQTDSQHACQTQRNQSEADHVTLTAWCGNSRITGKMGSHVTRKNLER